MVLTQQEILNMAPKPYKTSQEKERILKSYFPLPPPHYITHYLENRVLSKPGPNASSAEWDLYETQQRYIKTMQNEELRIQQESEDFKNMTPEDKLKYVRGSSSDTTWILDDKTVSKEVMINYIEGYISDVAKLESDREAAIQKQAEFNERFAGMSVEEKMSVIAKSPAGSMWIIDGKEVSRVQALAYLSQHKPEEYKPDYDAPITSRYTCKTKGEVDNLVKNLRASGLTTVTFKEPDGTYKVIVRGKLPDYKGEVTKVDTTGQQGSLENYIPYEGPLTGLDIDVTGIAGGGPAPPVSKDEFGEPAPTVNDAEQIQRDIDDKIKEVLDSGGEWIIDGKTVSQVQMLSYLRSQKKDMDSYISARKKIDITLDFLKGKGFETDIDTSGNIKMIPPKNMSPEYASFLLVQSAPSDATFKDNEGKELTRAEALKMAKGGFDVYVYGLFVAGQPVNIRDLQAVSMAIFRPGSGMFGAVLAETIEELQYYFAKWFGTPIEQQKELDEYYAAQDRRFRMQGSVIKGFDDLEREGASWDKYAMYFKEELVSGAIMIATFGLGFAAGKIVPIASGFIKAGGLLFKINKVVKLSTLLKIALYAGMGTIIAPTVVRNIVTINKTHNKIRKIDSEFKTKIDEAKTETIKSQLKRDKYFKEENLYRQQYTAMSSLFHIGLTLFVAHKFGQKGYKLATKSTRGQITYNPETGELTGQRYFTWRGKQTFYGPKGTKWFKPETVSFPSTGKAPVKTTGGLTSYKPPISSLVPKGVSGLKAGFVFYSPKTFSPSISTVPSGISVTKPFSPTKVLTPVTGKYPGPSKITFDNLILKTETAGTQTYVPKTPAKVLTPATGKRLYFREADILWRPEYGVRSKYLPSTKVWPKLLPHPRAYEHHFVTIAYMPPASPMVRLKKGISKIFTVKDLYKRGVITKPKDPIVTTSGARQQIVQIKKVITKQTTKLVTIEKKLAKAQEDALKLKNLQSKTSQEFTMLNQQYYKLYDPSKRLLGLQSQTEKLLEMPSQSEKLLQSPVLLYKQAQKKASKLLDAKITAQSTKLKLEQAKLQAKIKKQKQDLALIMTQIQLLERQLAYQQAIVQALSLVMQQAQALLQQLQQAKSKMTAPYLIQSTAQTLKQATSYSMYPFSLSKTLKKEVKGQQPYYAYVKRNATKKAKYVKTTKKPLSTEKQALGSGALAVDQSVSRTFYVEPSKETPASKPGYEKTWSQLKHKYRKPIRKGKPVKSNRWIEKTTHAIDSKGELEGITFKGQAQLKKMRAMGIQTRTRTKTKRRQNKNEYSSIF